MKMNKLAVVAGMAAMLTMNAAAAFEGQVQLGVGYGELTNGGASEYTTQTTARFEGQFDFGLVGDLRYSNADFSNSTNDLSQTALRLGYEFGLAENLGLAVGALAEQIDSSATVGVGVDDDVFGGWLGLSYDVSDGVELGVDVAYIPEHQQYDDALDLTLALDIQLAGDVTVGLEYWARAYRSDAAADVEQDAISILLGYQF